MLVFFVYAPLTPRLEGAFLMPGSRKAQQIRLWIYLLIILTCIVYSGYVGRGLGWLFPIVGMAMFLPFIEFCPRCRRLSWREKGANIFWIGAQCHGKENLTRKSTVERAE